MSVKLTFTFEKNVEIPKGKIPTDMLENLLDENVGLIHIDDIFKINKIDNK